MNLNSFLSGSLPEKLVFSLILNAVSPPVSSLESEITHVCGCAARGEESIKATAFDSILLELVSQNAEESSCL